MAKTRIPQIQGQALQPAPVEMQRPIRDNTLICLNKCILQYRHRRCVAPVLILRLFRETIHTGVLHDRPTMPVFTYLSDVLFFFFLMGKR